MTEPGTSTAASVGDLNAAEAAELLEISEATLRRWTNRFSSFLQDADGDALYSSQDLDVLARVRVLLEQGWTYEQVAKQLTEATEAVDVTRLKAMDDTAFGDLLNEETVPPDLDITGGQLQPVDGLNPAARFVRDAIQGIADNQQIILNAQQASRSLLGVMVQDNLNLKNEASSLRDRMLELERELAEQRRRQSDYRQRMETRVHVLEDAVARLMAAQMQPATPERSPNTPGGQQPPERRGFWSRLIGG